MKKPLISVLMTAYNEPEDHFKQALESILNQSFRDFEVVLIIDNPDNAILINTARSYEKKDERIRLFINEINLGLAASLNNGIDKAEGDYICRMDSDDISDEDRLAFQLFFLEENNLDLVGGQMRVIDDIGNALYRTGRLPNDPTKIKRTLKWNNCVPHPTWFAKKEVFTQKYRIISLCEDYDFLIRAVFAGYKLGNCSVEVLSYRMSQNSISRNNLYRQYLSQRFLCKEYRRKKEVCVEELSDWVRKKNTWSRSQRYVKANRVFNAATCQLSKGKIFIGVGNLIKIPILSFDYCCKLARLCVSSLIARI